MEEEILNYSAEHHSTFTANKRSLKRRYMTAESTLDHNCVCSRKSRLWNQADLVSLPSSDIEST